MPWRGTYRMKMGEIQRPEMMKQWKKQKNKQIYIPSIEDDQKDGNKIGPIVDATDRTFGTVLAPLHEIAGYKVRPGYYRMDGAHTASYGVSFSITSHGATSCTLLLFHPQESEPFAELPYPESYHIGDTYSMMVYGLQIEEFEYAFRLDGPYNPSKGLLFDKSKILLDPYAKAVTGQRKWGEKPEGGEDFVYKARVVRNDFDWGNLEQLEYPVEDLVIYEAHVRGFTKDKSSGVEEKGTFVPFGSAKG